MFVTNRRIALESVPYNELVVHGDGSNYRYRQQMVDSRMLFVLLSAFGVPFDLHSPLQLDSFLPATA